MRLNGKNDFDYAKSWVLACCVLHNACRQQDDPPLEAADAVGADEAWLGPGVHAHEARNGVLDKVCSFMWDSGTYRDMH